jgi:hypothetical protein
LQGAFRLPDRRETADCCPGESDPFGEAAIRIEWSVAKVFVVLGDGNELSSGIVNDKVFGRGGVEAMKKDLGFPFRDVDVETNVFCA